ncbi:SAM-dependent methyltransferase [Streptomyces sp. NPDC014894]|uniref:SAM-dependent methyltransferase n=1 Tax=unclassified Streptomyces TaxID=2593676 RepID=UPI0036F7005A
MESHRIADQYTIVPAQTPPLDVAAYEAALLFDFQDHYARGRDVWTDERAMRETPLCLLGALGATPDAHVLDIGTGRGLDAEILLDRGHRVTGIDLVASPEWGAITARRPGRARFLTASATELTGVAEYDAVLDNGCLHHQHPDSYPGYLDRIHALLRPGGLFTVSVFRSATDAGRLYVNGGSRLYREFTAGELTGLVTERGFETVDLRPVPRGTAGLEYLVGTFRATAPGDAR